MQQTISKIILATEERKERPQKFFKWVIEIQDLRKNSFCTSNIYI